MILAALIGLLAGGFGGLVGLGGGVLMVPLLTGWLRLTQHEAHGTSLVGVVFTGVVGAFAYARGGAVYWRDVAILALSSVAATYYAAHHSRRVPAALLRRWFAYFLLATAVALPLRESLPGAAWASGAAELPILVLTGVLVGIASGLLGIGGGALLVPLLVFGVGLGQHVAQGTSLAAMVPAGVSGTWVHWRHGHIRGRALLALLPGVAVGSWLGGVVALALPGPALRWVFTVVLLALGVHYLRSARRLEARSRRAAAAVPAPVAAGR